MADFYLPRTTERAEQIFANRPDLLEQYKHYSNRADNILLPHQPYLMTCAPGDGQTLQALNRFSQRELHNLQQIAAEYDELTLALAYVSEELIKPVMQLLDDHGTTATGAIVGAANSKYTVFQRAIVRYQQALQDLHEASGARANAGSRRAKGAYNPLIAAKEAQVKLMHADMNARFKVQLQRYAANLGAKSSRSALLNVDHGIDVARGRNNQRNGQTLRFANSQQVATVKRFVNDSQILGRGVLFLDVGLRGIEAYNADNSGREGVSQAFGFGASAGTGLAVAKATRVLGMALMLTPLGWKVLIGAAIVGGFMAASFTDEYFQEKAGRMYDKLRVRL